MVRAHKAEQDHTAAAVGDLRCPVYPQYLVDQVRKVMPSDGILCLDNGVYKIWFTRNYPAHMPNTFLVDNALATMGAGLPSAMASSMIFPDRKVMAVCGDGGFMMNSQELETAVRLKLNLVVLILNDNSYGMIRWKQAVDNFPDFGLTFGNPDFVKYAESYGAKGSRIESTEAIVPTLERAFSGGGVHLVVVPIDYTENKRVLVDELREKVQQIDVE
jgi:acetolactate synthase-1/2/3 large subunit